MKDENEDILTLLSDGRQRSFNEIQVSSGLESVQLENDLKLLSDDGLIEQTVVPEDDLYLITAKGVEVAGAIHA
jgi:predicted transcriptional regulator